MPQLRAPQFAEDRLATQSPTMGSLDLMSLGAPMAAITSGGTNPSLWQHLWDSVHGVPGAQVLKQYLPLAPIENQGVKMTNAAMDEIRALLKTMGAK